MARKKRKWVLISEEMDDEITTLAQLEKLPATAVMRDLMREALAVRREKGATGKLIIEGNGKRREIVVV